MYVYLVCVYYDSLYITRDRCVKISLPQIEEEQRLSHLCDVISGYVLSVEMFQWQ